MKLGSILMVSALVLLAAVASIPTASAISPICVGGADTPETKTCAVYASVGPTSVCAGYSYDKASGNETCDQNIIDNLPDF